MTPRRALLYVANWRFLAQSSDYFATDVEESPFLHFWSLAIEEQFYFVFPILLLLLTKATRRWGWALLAALGALFALSLGSQLYWARVDTNHAYYGTDARLYQLLAGVLLTVALRTWHVQVRRRTAELLAVGGLVLLLVLGSGLPPLSPSWRGIGAMVASVLLIAGLSLRDDGVLARGLARPVPVFLGRISYGTYLWHWPVILVLEEVLVVSPKIVAVLAVGVATGLAAASYEVLEMPIRTVSHLRRYTWSTVVAGVAASASWRPPWSPWSSRATGSHAWCRRPRSAGHRGRPRAGRQPPPRPPRRSDRPTASAGRRSPPSTGVRCSTTPVRCRPAPSSGRRTASWCAATAPTSPSSATARRGCSDRCSSSSRRSTT